MSLSDQIKQPGQIIGSGGGGGGGTTDAGDLTTGTLAAARLPGVLANVDTQAELLSAAAAAAASHTHAASDLTTGTVALARGGTNADLSATGGTGHVLKQSSAGAAVTVGALTASDVQLTSPVTTGGTSTAYTLTDTRIGTPADGQVFAFRVHTLSGTDPTLSVNGGTARNLKYRAWSGALTNLTAQYLSADQICLAAYRSATTDFEVLVGSLIHPGQIPATLNATTFAGTVTIGNNYIEGGGASGYTVISNQSTARFAAWGSSSAYPGANRYSCGSVAGSNHQFFDKNGAEQLRVDENGIQAITLAAPAGSVLTLCGGQDQIRELRLYGGNGSATGANLILFGDSHGTYPGAHQSVAPLDTRAASTAIPLCPVATGDMAYVTILESSIASCKVKVDTAGTVTFTDLDGNAASASIVNSSSPAAAEYGVYISAGVLYFKGGSSYAGKMASFSQIGKA